nr:MAG TPA: minor tail protein [Caudoviricetes sp.]
MADKSQQIKTDLIFKADDAINNIKELSDLLSKINGFTFSRTASGMDKFTKAVKDAVDSSQKATQTQTDGEQKVQNLLKQRIELIKKLEDAYSKNPKTANTPDWDKQTRALVNLNEKIADMYVNMGKARDAVKFLQESLNELNGKGDLGSVLRFDSNLNLLGKLKADLAAVDRMVKEKTNEFDVGKQIAESEKAQQKAYNQRIKDLQKFAKTAQAEYDSLFKSINSHAGVKGLLYTDEQQTADLKRLQGLRNSMRSIMGEEAWKNAGATAYSKLEEAYVKTLSNSKLTSGTAIQSIKDIQEQSLKSAIEVGSLGKELSNLKTLIESVKAVGNDGLYKELLGLYTQYAKVRKQVQDDIKASVNPPKAKPNQEAVQAAKAEAKAQRDAEKAAQQHLKTLDKLNRKWQEIKLSIENHSGADGLAYSHAALNNMIARIESLKKQYEHIGEKGPADLLNPSLLSGVNTTIGRFNSQLSDARVKAQELYMTFQKTKSEADRLRFLNARDDFVRLNDEAERFDRTISKTRRDVLSPANISKRAVESFNWMAGSAIENSIVNLPFTMVDKIKNFELEMAGIEQVLPKISRGQAEVNEEFSNFANIAGQYGQSVEDTLTAAKSLGRMYGGSEETADIGAKNTEILTAQAAKMATTDNFEMLAATQGLESALSQFNMQTEDSNMLMARSSHILDVWTKLAHTSGASAQDLTEGVKQAGASAHEAGISFEFLNALIATGVRTTAKSGNEIGTMLKSLFASMQQDKAIKAMQNFGIEVYKVGATGKKELRPMQDLIFDISKALETTNKDTKGVSDFLLAISGGKYQVSKVAALLGNYKELQRTLSSAGTSSGFTNKQLEMQMDTVSRKMQTLKSNISQLFQQAGSNGIVNDLKWALNILNNMTEGMKKSESSAYQWTKAILEVVAAYKLIPMVLNQIARAVGRARGQWAATAGMSAKGIIGFENPFKREWNRLATSSNNAKDSFQKAHVKNEESSVEDKNTTAQNTNTASRTKNKASIDAQSASLQSQTAIMNANTASTVSNTASQNKNVVSTKNHIQNAKKLGQAHKITNVQIKQGTTTLRSYSVAARTSAASANVASVATGTLSAAQMAGSAASRVAAGAIRMVSAAIWALGGPIGVAIEALSLFALNEAMTAEEAGEAEEAYRSWQEELENSITTAQEEGEEIQANAQRAEELADRYNELKDKLDELTSSTDSNAESSKEAGEIRKEMGSISNQIQQLMHADAIEFDKDGKINKKTIQDLAAADKQKCIQKLIDAQDEIQAEYDAKDALISSTEARIKAMEKEAHATTLLGGAYRALRIAIAGVAAVASAVFKFGAFTFSKDSFIGKGIRTIVGNGIADTAEGLLSSRAAYDWDIAKKNAAEALDIDKSALYEYGTIDTLAGEVAALKGEMSETENKYNSVGAMIYRLEYGVNPDGSPISNDEKIDPTRENVNADKEGTQPKPKKTHNPKGKKQKDPAYQHYEWTYGDQSSRVMATIVDELNADGWNKSGVTVPALMVLANLINGRNGTYWDDIPDLFGTGSSNPWDSGFALKDKLIDQFQQGKTLEDAFKALAPSVPQPEWDNAFGGSSNYIQYLTDHNNFDKFKRDFTGDDPYLKAGGGSEDSGYDYSVFTNPFLAEQAVIVSQKIKAKTGENVNPNQIYGTLMAETPQANENNYTDYLNTGGNRYSIGGMDGNFTSLEDWQDAMAATLTNGGYNNTPTTMDWVNALANNRYKSDANTSSTYIAAIDEYANEKGWFNTSALTGMASDVVDNAVASLGSVANESNNCVKSALAVLRQIPQMASDRLANSGILNGDDLIAQAGDYGWNVVPYDASKAVPGALITWYGDEGTNSHTGIVSSVENGNVYEYDTRSSQGHQLVKGTAEEKRQWGSNWYPEYLILPPQQLVGGSKNGNFKRRNRWHVGKDSLKSWVRNPIDEYVYDQENAQKQYEIQKKKLEIDKKQNGDTAQNAIRSYANEVSSLNATQGMADLWKNTMEAQKKELVNYINRNTGLLNAVKANGLTPEQFFDNLPDSEIEELFKDARDTAKEKDVKKFLTARKNAKETQQKADEKKASFKSEWYGFKSPSDSIDYQLKQLEQSHKESAYGSTQSETWQIDHDYYVNRIGLLEDKLDFFSKELRKIRQAEQARLEELANQISDIEDGTPDEDGNLSGGISQLEEKKDRTDEENKLLEEQKKKVTELRKEYQSLAKNHSDAYRDIESKTQQVNNQLEETKDKVNEIELAFREKLENGVANMFENIFLEGKSFRDSWKDLWKDIGKLAWEQLVKVNLLSNVQKWSGAIGDIFGGKHSQRTAVTPELVSGMMAAPINAMSIAGGYRTGSTRAGSRQITALTGRAIDGTYFPMSKKIPVSSESVLDTMAGTGAQQVNNNLKNFGAQLQKGNMVWQNMATPLQQLGQATPLLETATMASRASVIQQIASTGVNTAAVNANTAAQSSSSITGGILGHANGGSLAKFASGGSIGLISGAGTGTSDSILTYLAHQGRFIATSNGEYIIKKSSVDRLGVNFLDMINQNPEAAAGLKRYADGGSLGENMVPVMSPKTVDSYNSLNKNHAVIKMNSNKKLEQLMAQQNEMIGKMGNKSDSGNLVVLNTQADSGSVMKALAKNPRMVQRILGGQKKHGFGR